MSEDESTALIFNVFIAGTCWGLWYKHTLQVHRLLARGGPRRMVLWTPALAMVVLAVVLTNLAASDVRNSTGYLFFYMFFGAAWVGTFVHTLPRLGLSVRDDVAERRNRAAGWAISGAILALTLCFAGANIGEGPSWTVVLFSAGLSTLTLGLLWRLLHALFPVVERITLDRDVAVGRRTGLLLVAVGLVLGRAVAGDWHSAGETVRDFGIMAWPAVVLVVAAGAAERRLPRAGALAWMLPGALYVASATSVLVVSGQP